MDNVWVKMMHRYIVLLLQFCSLVFSWYKAFQIGRCIAYHKSSFSVAHGAKTEVAKRNESIELRNLVCNSSVEDSQRHNLMVTFRDVKEVDNNLFHRLLIHSSWANHTLSHHCVDTMAMIHCTAILQGGGHLFAIWYCAHDAVEFTLFSGCGLLWKRDQTTVKDVTDLVKMLISLLYKTENEERINDLLMGKVSFSHHLRTYEFSQPDSSLWDNNPLHSDLSRYYLSLSSIHKKPVVPSIQTDFQTIQILDVQGFPGHALGVTDRVVFLDGVIQSTAAGDSRYHEALVQPGMFTAANPKRVAIIGGGEGATLREVLKHKSIEQVYMIEIDPIMVQTCRDHLTQWNSCQHIEGSAVSCFDDPRTILIYEDAVAWFVYRFSATSMNSASDQICNSGTTNEHITPNDSSEASCEVRDGDNMIQDVQKFDVIIMDALDPQDNVEFADMLYNSDKFFFSLFNALTDDGILIMQLGIARYLHDPPFEFTSDKTKINFVSKLSEQYGFESLYAYEESNFGFLAEWTFMLACKNAELCHKKWYSNAAYKELEIHRRLKRRSDPSSQQSLLNYVDGTVLERYQIPSAANEELYCRSRNAPYDCRIGRGYHFYSSMTNKSHLINSEVINVKRNDGELVLTAKVDIAKGDYITDHGLTMTVERSTVQVLNSSTMSAVSEASTVSSMLLGFTPGGETTTKYEGVLPTGPTVMFPFTNSTTGSPNMGSLSFYITQGTFQGEKMLTSSHRKSHNFVMDRHLSTYGGGGLIALKDISAGEVLALAC